MKKMCHFQLFYMLVIASQEYIYAGNCFSRPLRNENLILQDNITKTNNHSSLLENIQKTLNNNNNGYQKLIESVNAHATQLLKLTNAAKKQFTTSNNLIEEQKKLALSTKDIYTKISILQAQINSLQMQINNLKGYINPQERLAKLEKIYKQGSNSPKNITRKK